MTKRGGLGENFYVGAFNISGDVGVVDEVSCPMTPLRLTGIDKFAWERGAGRRDGLIEFTSFFNDASGQEHLALSGLPTADVVVTNTIGTTLFDPACSMVGKQVNYDGARDDEGNLTLKTRVEANGFGQEWGELHTAGVRTDGSATNGTGVDGLAATSFGLAMYVHLFAFTGTSVTIKLQESSDDGAGDAYADVVGATTGALSSAQALRVATANNLAVERHLRVVTTGTFSSAVFAVNVVRYLSAPVF